MGGVDSSPERTRMGAKAADAHFPNELVRGVILSHFFYDAKLHGGMPREEPMERIWNKITVRFSEYLVDLPSYWPMRVISDAYWKEFPNASKEQHRAEMKGMFLRHWAAILKNFNDAERREALSAFAS